MKFFFFITIFLFPLFSIASEYSLKILGENKIRDISVDKEKLELAETTFKWTDSEANFGKGYCLGSIITISEDVKLNFLCEFLDYEGESFWTKIYRHSSEISSGLTIPEIRIFSNSSLILMLYSPTISKFPLSLISIIVAETTVSTLLFLVV